MTPVRLADPTREPLSRLALSEITVAPAAGIEERIAATVQAGIPGYGAFRPIHSEGQSGADLRRMLDAAGLQASFAVPRPFTVRPMLPFNPVSGRREPRGLPPQEAENAILADLRWFAELEPAAVMVLTGAQGDDSRSDAWAQAGEALQRLDAQAQSLGLEMLLEFINPRYAGDSDLIESIDDALRMLDDIGTSNMRLLLDSFHVWELEDLHGQIARAAGRIGGVHLSDSTRFPRSAVDRLPPGTGDIDLAGFIAAIEATGYTGWYELEVVSDDGSRGGYGFPDSWWLRPPSELLDACVTGYTRAFEAAAEHAITGQRAHHPQKFSRHK